MEHLRCNFSGRPRQVIKGDVEYLVAPLTMIVEGVLNGSDGPIYYPASVLSKNPSIWNGVWMVLDHPKKDGKYISVTNGAESVNQEVVDAFGLGIVQNATFVEDGNKLVAEGWFEVNRVQRVRSSLLSAILNAQPVELSTGLGGKTKKAPSGSEFNGTVYNKVVQDIKPDHLAILPDSIGACSITDGCGVNNEASHEELRQQLIEALRSKFTQDQASVWMYEVYDSYFIYEQGNKLFKLSYTKSETGVALGEESPVEVVREVNYIETTNEQKETSVMKLSKEQRTAVIAEVIANSCGCWKKGDEELLNSLPDVKLTELAESGKVAKVRNELVANLEAGFEVDGQVFKLDSETGTVVNSDPEEDGEEDDETDPALKSKKVQNTKGKPSETAPLGEKEWMDKAPESVRNALGMAAKIMKREKTRLIDKLVANVDEKAEKVTRQRLEKKSLEDLELMASLVGNRKTHTEDGDEDFEDEEDVLNYIGKSSGVPEKVLNRRKKTSSSDEILEPSLDIDWEALANEQRQGSK